MVGVAGRSKACGTCKKRHVRCDERHPNCLRCEKSGFTCTGYARKTIFIDSTSDTKDRVNSTSRSRPKLAKIATHDVQLSVSTSELIIHASHEKVAQYAPPRVVSFIMNYLGAGGFREHRPVRIKPYLAISDLALQAAAVAMGGQLEQNTESIDRGMRLYSRALQHIRRELFTRVGDPRSIPTNEQIDAQMLTRVMNLALYEWVSNTAGNSWKSHIHALAALIKMCRPQDFRRDPMRVCFERARAHIIALHMADEKRTFLEEPCWQSVPWDNNPHDKSFTNHFLDIMACIAGLLEDESHLQELRRQIKDASENRARQLADQFESVMWERIGSAYTRLVSLRWRWEVEYGNCCFEVPTPATFKTQLRPFETVFFFKTFARAIEVNHYHVSYMILRLLARSLGKAEELRQISRQPDLKFDAKSTNASVTDISMDKAIDKQPTIALKTTPFSFKTNKCLLLPGEAESDLHAAFEICRTAHYFLQPKHHPVGAFFLIVSLRTAQICIQSHVNTRNSMGSLFDNRFLSSPNTAYQNGSGVMDQTFAESAAGSGGPFVSATEIATPQAADSELSERFQIISESLKNVLLAGNRKNKYHESALLLAGNRMKNVSREDYILSWLRVVMQCIAKDHGLNIANNYM